MKKIPASAFLYGAAGLVVIGMFALIVRGGASSKGPSIHDGFAQCLAEKKVTMYGAWWCPHCKDQKELFGSAFQYVPYVECSPGADRQMSQECKDAGVTGYPMWIYADGTKLSGSQTLEAIGKQVGCGVGE